MARHLVRATDRFRCALAFAVLVAIFPSQAFAQKDSGRYSLVALGAPLDAALETLVARTRIDLAYDPPLVRDKRTSCAAEDQSAEDLLRCVLQGTGLDFYRLSSGLYVLIKTPETVPLYGGLRGIVVDAETHQPLPHSHVMLADHEIGTTANNAGMFAFARLKPGRYVVLATHVGYEAGTATVEVPPGGSSEAELALESHAVLVQPIVIDGLQWRLPSADLGTESLSQDDLLGISSSGATDVLAGLNSLLGVRVSDATADIHVQGGETGEHQLRLDGAPVFLPLNFASFVGPFSPFAIGTITVHKAGFGASEGSQIAGVIDLYHDMNVQEGTRLAVQADPLSVNARLSLKRGRAGGLETTFTTAGRLGLWSLYAPPPLKSLLDDWSLTDPFLFTLFDRSDDNPRFETRPTTGNPGIGFSDIHFASRTRFGLLRSLHASAYVGQSRLGSDFANPEPLSSELRQSFAAAQSTGPYRDLFTFDTGVAQARYEMVLGSRTMASAGVRGSFYKVRHDYSVPDSLGERGGDAGDLEDEFSAIDDGNRIYEVATEARLDYVLNNTHILNGGLDLIRTGTRFAVLGTQRYPISHRSPSWRAAGYVEDEISIGRRITVDAGARATYLASHDSVYFEPRLSLRYDQSESIVGMYSVRLSVGRYRQFINQFDVSSRSPRALLSSTRFWLAADESVVPPAATHYAAELLLQPAKHWTLRLEGYFKDQDHILSIDYATPAGVDRINLQQNEFLVSSRGTVQGGGIQIQRQVGSGRIEARYEFNVAKRTIDGFYDDGPQFAPWNEPHRMEFAVDLVPWKPVTFLARWRGIWGRTWGFRQGYYDFIGAFDTIADDLPSDLIPKAQRQIDKYRLNLPDTHELPPIYQLDLSAAYTHQITGSSLQLRADLLNVLDRRNVAEWYLWFDEETYYQSGEDGGFLQKRDRPLLPRLLSVAVKWTW